MTNLNKRLYSTNNISSYPLFITGLFDAEGSFVVTILKNCKYKTGWNVQARVQIKMHEKDRPLILAIRNYFGGRFAGSLRFPSPPGARRFCKNKI